MPWCKDAVGTLWLAWLGMVGLLTSRVCVLVVAALALRREGETTGFVDVEEMNLKFGKWWQSFVIEFGATDVSVEAMVRSGVE